MTASLELTSAFLPFAGAALSSGPAPGLVTPYLDLDVPAAVTRYRRLAAAFRGTAVHYAVKANP
jgi:diaminopimelate decarboxylase